MSLIEYTAWAQNPENPLQIEYYIFFKTDEIETDPELKAFLGENYIILDYEDYANDLLDFIIETEENIVSFIKKKQDEGYQITELCLRPGIPEPDVEPYYLLIIILETTKKTKNKLLKLVKK